MHLSAHMLVPSVSRYMTAKPITIARTATLAEAHRTMRAHGIRHLPVIDEAGNLCGEVSQRDLHLIETLSDVDLETVRVEEAMVERPFIVTGDTALEEVVEIMGEHKYGSAIVMGRDGVEGIFTAVDACNVLAELLHEEAVPT